MSDDMVLFCKCGFNGPIDFNAGLPLYPEAMITGPCRCGGKEFSILPQHVYDMVKEDRP